MADFNAFHNRVQRRVISYGIVCPVEVIIYCAGKPDARNIIFFCKNLRPCKRTVSASLDGVADGLRCKFRYLVVNQALVTTVYSHNLPTVEDGSPCDGPNSRIHSGSVSAGGEHSHSRNLCNNQLK